MTAAEEKSLSAGRQSAEDPAAEACHGCGCVDREDGRAEEAPEWRERLDQAEVRQLDVRPILAAGEAPLAIILQTADGVPTNGVLMIEAPFDPQPLRRVLAAKGFSTFGERRGPGHWQIWCRRAKSGEDRPVQAKGPRKEAQTWRVGEVVHIDVRGLEAPRPLVAILALIDGGEHSGHIVVHHNRDPLYLYPELEDRGWQYARRLELRGPR